MSVQAVSSLAVRADIFLAEKSEKDFSFLKKYAILYLSMFFRKHKNILITGGNHVKYT